MACGWIFAYIIWNGRSTKVAKIIVIHWHLTFLRQGQVCFCMDLYGPHTFVWKKLLIISNGFSSEASGPVLLKFHAEPPWAGEWKIAKMGMVRWSKWLPCLYMVKTFKNLLLHNQISPGSYICTNYGGQEIYQNCSNDGSMLTFDLFASKVKFASLFVCAIYIYI